jgi:RTX calcium-binding nonapeptide repeat (4 copies)
MIAFALWLPAGAQAATVRFVPEDEPTATDAYLDVADTAGQRNDLEVTFGRRLTVVERGSAPLKAGRGCKRPSRQTVTCAIPELVEVEVDAGAGADRVTTRCSRSAGVNMFGEAGADRLHVGRRCTADVSGGPGADVLTGESGREFLFGGTGRDRLAGGGGRDLLWGEGDSVRPSPDVIDGGSGRDTVLYTERSVRVRVDLRRGIGGHGREHDRLRRVEDVFGGRAGDVLAGNDHANRLEGGRGEDLLIGRGGNDRLDGGNGESSGLFDDNRADRFDCGAGDDIVTFPGSRALRLDCERMQASFRLADRTLPTRPRPLGRHRVAVRVVCRSDVDSCRRRVEVRAGKKLLGRAERKGLHAGVNSVVVSLRGRARGDGAVRIKVEGEDEYVDGEPIPYRFAWRLACAGAPRKDVCRAGARAAPD